MNTRIAIRKPFDGHTHMPRQILHFLLATEHGSLTAQSNAFDTFRALIALMARMYSGAVVMPNLSGGWISTPEHAKLHYGTLHDVLVECGRPNFRLLPTFRITHQTTPAMVAEFHDLGILRGKIYPTNPEGTGGTTNSSGGIWRFDDSQLFDVLREMARRKMFVLSHNEMPGSPNETAEQDFIPVVSKWLDAVPSMLFGFEHVSSKEAVKFVLSAGSNVFATVTPQHLTQTESDWKEEGGGSTHNWCKPPMKTRADRAAIVAAVIFGHSRFGFGSDCAPHRAETKERGPGRVVASGCANFMAGIPTIIEVFEQLGALDKLDGFMSGNFCAWNGIPTPTEQVTYVREPWVVPERFYDIVNWRPGETMNWQAEQAT